MSQSDATFIDYPAPTARLLVQKGPQPNQIFELTLDQLTIGRSATNPVAITDPEISRKHARLIRQGNDYAIEDLGSTNGTFVNDRRIVGLTPLHDGDIIEFGEAIRLLYEAQSTLPVELPAVRAPSAAQPVAAQPLKSEPLPRPAAARQVPPPPVYAPQPSATTETVSRSSSCRRNALLGCGLFILLIFLCTASLFFLDAYQQGRLLYCGPLQSFWKLLLGPFGFAPLCP